MNILKMMSVIFLVLTTLLAPLNAQAAINARGPSGNNVVSVPSSPTEEQPPLPDNVSGQILDSRGNPVQVQVIFKNQTMTQENSIFPGRVYFPTPPLITDTEGHYQLHLDDGQWIGYACGSQWGYQPLFWKVSVFNNVITSYEELSHIAPVIENINVSLPNLERNPSFIPPGTEISITGDWFGCSGKVLLIVEGAQKEITTFINHQNKLVKFSLPDLSDRGISHVKAFGITYVNGNSRSKFASWRLRQQPQPTQESAGTTSSASPEIPKPGILEPVLQQNQPTSQPQSPIQYGGNTMTPQANTRGTSTQGTVPARQLQRK